MNVSWADIKENDTSFYDYFWSVMEKYGHVRPQEKKITWKDRVVGMSAWRTSQSPPPEEPPKKKSNRRRQKKNK
jgi:hypothetical protein